MEEQPTSTDRDDADRVVSRRVRNPTTASAGDEAAYRAADPVPADEVDSGRAGTGEASATEAAAETAAETGEPERSE